MKKDLLKSLPGVDRVLEECGKKPFFSEVPKSVLKKSIRAVLDSLRKSLLSQKNQANEINSMEPIDMAWVMDMVQKNTEQEMSWNLNHVINGTGVVVHTNLGRSLLSEEALSRINRVGRGYSNLEFDLEKGERGLRYKVVEDLLCEISGAEAAMVVNNNAGAVLLSLDTIAKGKKVIVSRGELVEIGGSFRIPDVMVKSGAFLKEVGTTNRTHLKDYQNNIDEETGLLLKVHTSNYAVIGFTKEVSLKELVVLGKEKDLPVMEDLGSGTFVDFSRFGIKKEPMVQESVAAGADIITFSGDKLLGGPQAGLIIGKKTIIAEIRKNPLTRALRIDKLTLAALEATLRLYRDPETAVNKIPTLKMLSSSVELLEARAEKLRKALEKLGDKRLRADIHDVQSKTGGGALPLVELPSKSVAVSIHGLSANDIEKSMRQNSPPVIGRIENDLFLMDVRTVLDDEIKIIADSLAGLLVEINGKDLPCEF